MRKNILVASAVACLLAVLLFSWNVTQAAPLLDDPTKLLPFEPEKVLALEVSTGAKSVMVERTVPTRTWQITTPSSAKANDNQIAQLLNSLSSIIVTQPIAEPAKDWFAKPAITVTIIITESAPLELKISAKEVNSSTVYAQISEGKVYTIPSTIKSELTRFVDASNPTPTLTPTKAPPTPTITPTAIPATPVPTVAPTTPAPTASPIQTATPTLTITPTATPTPSFGVPGLTLPQGIPWWLVALGAMGLVLLVALLVLLGRLISKKEPSPDTKTIKIDEPKPPREEPPTGPYLELEPAVGRPKLEFNLTRSGMTLGRAADCDFKIADAVQGSVAISRHHARFELRNHRWVVIDGGADGKPSTNGVYVNGKRTLENYLKENDEVKFGGLAFRFHLQRTPNSPAEGV